MLLLRYIINYSSNILLNSLLFFSKQKQKNVDLDDSEKESCHNAATHPSDVLDMPVDPNEPTYCLCHQVSYGEMIGCDNPDVSFIFYNTTQARNVIMYILTHFSALLNGSILPVLV